MRDRYRVFPDGRRVFVRDLTLAEIRDTLDGLETMAVDAGSDCTVDEMRSRLDIEQLIRAKGWR